MNDDQVDEADPEENTESDSEERKPNLFYGMRKGIRKLFGAARNMTTSFIKRALLSLIHI